MNLREFWTESNKIERRCPACRQSVPVGAVAYVRQVTKIVGGSLTKTAPPRWQSFHEACAAQVGAKSRAVLPAERA